MGCIPFCCCFKNIEPRMFAYIALGCDIAKLILAITGIFLIEFSIVLGGAFLNIFDFFPTVANLILMVVLVVTINSGSAFDSNNSCCRCICITSLVLSIIMIIMKIIFFAVFIHFYNKVDKWIRKEGIDGASTSDWLKLIFPFTLYFTIEIMHIICAIYIYKLLYLKSKVCYKDYVNKSPTAPVSVTVSNTPIIQNSPIFQKQSTPSGQQNVIN